MSDVLSSRPDLCGSEAVGADVAHVLDVVPHHNITHPAERERGSLVIGNGFLVADASFVADYGAIVELSHRTRPAASPPCKRRAPYRPFVPGSSTGWNRDTS
jgi:hypothetical protein